MRALYTVFFKTVQTRGGHDKKLWYVQMQKGIMRFQKKHRAVKFADTMKMLDAVEAAETEHTERGVVADCTGGQS